MKTIDNTGRQPIRVGIRGISGMLGRRLALDIEANPDIQVAFGTVKNDRNLTYLSGLLAAISQESRTRLTKHLYMEEKQQVVYEANVRTRENFQPLDQMPPLDQLCDVFLDATRRPPNKKNVFDERYPSFSGTILLQSAEYPRGRLISPPIIEPENDATRREPNIYRQGDCILSGIVPVLAAIASLARQIRLNVVMQLDEPLNTFPTQQNVVGMYPRRDAANKVEEQLHGLFPGHEIEVDSVIQIPSHDTYTATIHATVPSDTTHEDIKAMLTKSPRVRIAPAHILSTPDLDQSMREPANMLGRQISPITVYDAFLETKRRARENVIRIQLAIYSRLAAVLPNIDSIRILGSNISALEAMELTDKNLKL